jgi:hypothetical protein
MQTNPGLARSHRFLLALSPRLYAFDVPAAPAAEPPAPDPFAGAPYRIRDARTGRISSWDRTGGNQDFRDRSTSEIER